MPNSVHICVAPDPKFQAALEIDPETGCHNWTRAVAKNGYGKLSRRGVPQSQPLHAHRYAWYLAYGSMPDGFLCHTCDNRRCVNVEHLYVGNNSSNMRDAAERRRLVNPAGPQKLSPADVREIRASIARKEPYRKIAERYGIGEHYVSEIKRGRSWSWL